MSEMKKYYCGYAIEIEKVDTNSPYDGLDLNKIYFKSIITPPKEKTKRCLNIGFHNIEFTVNYIAETGFAVPVTVKCDIKVYKDEGYVTLVIDDKELNKREDILEDVSKKLIHHIEGVLDIKLENKNLIKRDKMGNLCTCTNNDKLTPTPEFQKLLLKQIVNSGNPLEEIKRILELINTIKNYFE